MKLHPTTKVIDSTKLNTYLSCPRKYFFGFVLGWQPEEPSNHLIFGIAWHEAMEVLLKARSESSSPGYPEEVLPAAFHAFIDSYRESLPPETDDLYAPKNPENVALALQQYIDQWKHDRFKLLFPTEISGSVPVLVGDHEVLFYYRLDAVVEDPDRGICFLEHKTTGRAGSTWEAEWVQAIQPGTYLHAMHSIGLPKPTGLINGAVFRKPPRLKADGTPYANSGKGNEFIRVPISKNGLQMQEWLVTLGHWLGQLIADQERVAAGAATDPAGNVMLAFPKNPKSCTDFGICPYHDICVASSNPIAWADAHSTPAGFEVRYWDPRSLDNEDTTKLGAEANVENSC